MSALTKGCPKSHSLRLIKEMAKWAMSWWFSIPGREALAGAELSALLQLPTGNSWSPITCGAGKQRLGVILTFLHIKPPPFPRSVFFLAFSTSCKCPHKCKILELINCLVLILPSSRKNIALPDLQATPLGSRPKRLLYHEIVIFLKEFTISIYKLIFLKLDTPYGYLF